MKFTNSIVAISLVLLSGCAGIVRGTSDQITVNSLTTGTTIYVDGAPRGLDNVTTDIKRGNAHAIRVEKAGCQDVNIATTERFDATSLLGILIDFGIITIPIDLITGAAWKAEPKFYTVTPICKT
jgi:hypothetical protein